MCLLVFYVCTCFLEVCSNIFRFCPDLPLIVFIYLSKILFQIPFTFAFSLCIWLFKEFFLTPPPLLCCILCAPRTLFILRSVFAFHCLYVPDDGCVWTCASEWSVCWVISLEIKCYWMWTMWEMKIPNEINRSSNIRWYVCIVNRVTGKLCFFMVRDFNLAKWSFRSQAPSTAKIQFGKLLFFILRIRIILLALSGDEIGKIDIEVLTFAWIE